MRNLFGIFFAILSLASTASVCNAGNIEVFKKATYDLTLKNKTIKAGSSIVETFDIDTIKNKLPDQIFSTVETGEWVYNLPSDVGVSNADKEMDKIIEYWEVSFAKVKNGGKVVFSRVITNNDSVDRDSYTWNLKVTCRFVKYR
jgi:hypothetical protein